MTTEAPTYQGLTPVLVPADGARYHRKDWPHFFGFSGTEFFPDGTFCVMNKPPEVVNDPQTFSHIYREYFIDLRTGKGHIIEATAVEDQELILRR